MTAPARGGEGRGGGGGGGGGGGRHQDFGARTLGLIYGFTQRHTPPPPRWAFCGVGVSGEGIKRWGIEGIRIGTSDRFGRGRGEFPQFRLLIRVLQDLYGEFPKIKGTLFWGP